MSVVAIIPAYNEEKTIGAVLKTLTQLKVLDEIIVISDGSTDNTVLEAKKYNVEVIELKQNQGKTKAIFLGVNNSNADTILMLDADLIGLTPKHVIALINPVLSGEYDMSIGVFRHGRGATDFAQKIAPFLSGQRAINRKVFEKLQSYHVKDYGIEMALTQVAEKEKIRVKQVELWDLTHVMKEEKRGILIGLLSRIKMYWDVIFSAIKIKLEMMTR